MSDSPPRERFLFRSSGFFLFPFRGECRGGGPSVEPPDGGSGLKRSPATARLLPPPLSSSLRPFFRPFLWDLVFFLPSSCDWDVALSRSSLPAVRTGGGGGGLDSRWSLVRLRESDGAASEKCSPRLSPARTRSPRGSRSSWRLRPSLLSPPPPRRSSSFQRLGLSSAGATLGGERSRGSCGRTTWLSRRCFSPPVHAQRHTHTHTNLSFC